MLTMPLDVRRFEHQTSNDDRPILPKVVCLTVYRVDENLNLVRMIRAVVRRVPEGATVRHRA
jgi:hypothetical protein